jgi:hypothetical protein
MAESKTNGRGRKGKRKKRDSKRDWKTRKLCSNGPVGVHVHADWCLGGE